MNKRKTGLLLGICMALSVTACGNSGGDTPGADNVYSMWIYSGADSSYYTDYRENPAIQYALSKTWGPEDKKIELNFWVPPGGSATDNYSTMITSGDYADVIDGSVAGAPLDMYGNGIIMELTDLVEENMPNYMAYLESHPSIRSDVYYEVDGEEKILAIVSANDDYPYYFNGPQYRRDWIVKYGKNPVTGEGFTGGYSDPLDIDSWEDNVVFPSGGSDPVYISDWEWMFEIFTVAMEDLGITDSYCISVYYPGFTWNGGLSSCFGGGCPLWYAPEEDNQVQFGGVSDQFRAYLQCLRTWYDNGWLDKKFNERTSDMFYQIDSAGVRQGKVGMWIGEMSTLGGRMDVGDELTSGICSYGCSWPINDIYGDASCQNIPPDCITTSGLRGTTYYISTKAAEKDVVSLLSLFDYFYGEEGSLLRTFGLNQQQQEEMQNQLYKDYGLEEGAYYIAEDGRFTRNEVLVNDGGNLKDAVRAEKVPGILRVANVDQGYEPTYEHSLENWIAYPNKAFFNGSSVTNNMPTDVSNEIGGYQTKILEYLTQNTVDFIKGSKDPFDDGDWDVWCQMLAKYNYQKVSDLVQPYVDRYSFR